MKEVKITIDLLSRRGRYEVSLQLDESITCGETLKQLLEILELEQSRKRGRWQLVETWRGCGKHSRMYGKASYI